MKSLYEKLNIHPRLSTAFHPQTDGQTERVNQILEGFLRTYISHRQDDWAELLPFAEFAYNNAPHSSTGTSPFYTSTGFHPTISVSNKESPESIPAVEEVVRQIQEIQEEVRASLEMAK